MVFKATEKELLLIEKEMNLSFERNIESKQDKKSSDTDSYFAKVFLLTETDDGFYFKSEDNKVIFFRRDSVLHITYFETVF